MLFNEYSMSLQHFTMTRPQSHFYLPAVGGLGWGLPAALGAKLEAPDRTMVAVCGDGTYMFANPVAAHHASRKHGLPVLTVIGNNARWNAVDWTSRLVYPEGAMTQHAWQSLSDLRPAPDFEKVVEASGEPGQPGSLAQAIASIRLTSTSGTAAADAETTRSTLDRYESQRPAPPLLRLAAGISLTKSEALADAKVQLTGIIDVARRHVEPFTLAPALVWRSAVLLRLGEVRASEADAYTALEWSDNLMAALACARLADALVEQGRVDEACRIFTQARVFDAELNPDSVYTPPVLFSRGRLRILSGDVDAGIGDLRLCGALEDAWEPARSSTGWRSSAAMALRSGKSSNGWLWWTYQGRPLAEIRQELVQQYAAASESQTS